MPITSPNPAGGTPRPHDPPPQLHLSPAELRKLVTASHDDAGAPTPGAPDGATHARNAMPIEPLRTGVVQHPEAARPVRRPDAPAQPRPSTDRVELSAESRVLTERPDAVPQGTLSTERLREVAGRLASGHYDSVDVRGRIAAGLARDTDFSGTE